MSDDKKNRIGETTNPLQAKRVALLSGRKRNSTREKTKSIMREVRKVKREATHMGSWKR